MAERHYIVPDVTFTGFFVGERTMQVESIAGYATAKLDLRGPRGGTRDSFRVSADWLTQAAEAFLLAASVMRQDEDDPGDPQKEPTLISRKDQP